MNRTIKILGLMTLLVLPSCVVDAQSYNDSRLDAQVHYDNLTAGERAYQTDQMLDLQFQQEKMQRDIEEQNYEIRQQQIAIDAEGNY